MEPLFTSSQIAEDSTEFDVTSPVGITCDSLTGTEALIILIKKLDNTFQPLTDGGTVLLTANRNTTPLVSPGTYKLRKPATTNPVSAGYTTT